LFQMRGRLPSLLTATCLLLLYFGASAVDVSRSLNPTGETNDAAAAPSANAAVAADPSAAASPTAILAADGADSDSDFWTFHAVSSADEPNPEVWTFQASTAEPQSAFQVGDRDALPGSGDVWTFQASSADGTGRPEVWSFDASEESTRGEVWTFDSSTGDTEGLSPAAVDGDTDNADGWWGRRISGDADALALAAAEERDVSKEADSWWDTSKQRVLGVAGGNVAYGSDGGAGVAQLHAPKPTPVPQRRHKAGGRAHKKDSAYIKKLKKEKKKLLRKLRKLNKKLKKSKKHHKKGKKHLKKGKKHLKKGKKHHKKGKKHHKKGKKHHKKGKKGKKSCKCQPQ
jgi:hypothetical protein